MTTDRFENIIDFAIKSEIAAYELYEKYAGIVTNPAQKKLLSEMAAMERGHEQKLRKLYETGKAVFVKPQDVQDLKIADYLVDVELRESSPIEDVFIFAMKSEQKAFDLYSRLAGQEQKEEYKNLFLGLAGEEKKHKHDLEVEYEKGIMNEN
ncbi:MAG: hypothetical protein GF401_15095 [Chitinivibrionales bacterium]|nr:hypothetical protein [Chitinivibrionales bacterium]